jgi:hypothetical protein
MSTCDEALEAALEKSREFYEPIITETATVVVNMQEQGADPTKQYDHKSGKVVNYVQLLKDLSAQAEADAEHLVKDAEKCKETTNDNDASSAEKFLQTMVDSAVAYYTGGLSLILPKHFTHISANDILEGRLFGGPNSVVQGVTGVIFDSLGMGRSNDLRKIVENPVKVIAKVIPDVTIRLPRRWKIRI